MSSMHTGIIGFEVRKTVGTIGVRDTKGNQRTPDLPNLKPRSAEGHGLTFNDDNWRARFNATQPTKTVNRKVLHG